MGLKPGLALPATLTWVAADCALAGCAWAAGEACTVLGGLVDAVAAGRVGSSGCVGVVSVSVSKSPECAGAGAAVVAATAAVVAAAAAGAGAGSGVGVAATAGATVGAPIAWRNDARAWATASES